MVLVVCVVMEMQCVYDSVICHPFTEEQLYCSQHSSTIKQLDNARVCPSIDSPG